MSMASAALADGAENAPTASALASSARRAYFIVVLPGVSWFIGGDRAAFVHVLEPELRGAPNMPPRGAFGQCAVARPDRGEDFGVLAAGLQVPQLLLALPQIDRLRCYTHQRMELLQRLVVRGRQ